MKIKIPCLQVINIAVIGAAPAPPEADKSLQSIPKMDRFNATTGPDDKESVSDLCVCVSTSFSLFTSSSSAVVALYSLRILLRKII